MRYVDLIRPTRFGPVGLLWDRSGDGVKITRVVIATPQSSAEERLHHLAPGCQEATCGVVREIAVMVRSFLSGDPVGFSPECLEWGACSAFQRAVLGVTRGIPRGDVISYGRLAERLGCPAAVRAVGRALACNPFPILVPCHRVIRSDGQLGGYLGGGVMKRALLEMEAGVAA